VELQDTFGSSRLELDEQLVSGAWAWNTKGRGFRMTTYNNITNVLARIRGSNSSSAVLFSAHIDGTLWSPAASDDGVHAAVLLEMVGVLCSQESTTTSPYLALRK